MWRRVKRGLANAGPLDRVQIGMDVLCVFLGVVLCVMRPGLYGVVMLATSSAVLDMHLHTLVEALRGLRRFAAEVRRPYIEAKRRRARILRERGRS